MDVIIMEMLGNSIGAASGYFMYVMDSLGGIGQIWLWFVMLHSLFRFIIRPVFGSAGSDRASKKHTKFSKSGGDGE